MTALAALPVVVDIAAPIVQRIVWAAVATVSPDGEPRTRLMHPVWDWAAEPAPTALVTARATPLKLSHVRAQPVLSCFYWDPAQDTVAIDAVARWLEPSERPAAWDAIKAVDPPVGFDPAIVWPDGPDSPGWAMLQLTARRVLARPAGTAGVMWRCGR
jgi:hypothetical protein